MYTHVEFTYISQLVRCIYIFICHVYWQIYEDDKTNLFGNNTSCVNIECCWHFMCIHNQIVDRRKINIFRKLYDTMTTTTAKCDSGKTGGHSICGKIGRKQKCLYFFSSKLTQQIKRKETNKVWKRNKCYLRARCKCMHTIECLWISRILDMWREYV